MTPLDALTAIIAVYATVVVSEAARSGAERMYGNFFINLLPVSLACLILHILLGVYAQSNSFCPIV